MQEKEQEKEKMKSGEERKKERKKLREEFNELTKENASARSKELAELEKRLHHKCSEEMSKLRVRTAGYVTGSEAVLVKKISQLESRLKISQETQGDCVPGTCLLLFLFVVVFGCEGD